MKGATLQLGLAMWQLKAQQNYEKAAVYKYLLNNHKGELEGARIEYVNGDPFLFHQDGGIIHLSQQQYNIILQKVHENWEKEKKQKEESRLERELAEHQSRLQEAKVDSAIKNGLKPFEIDGVVYYALNYKNALKKSKK